MFSEDVPLGKQYVTQTYTHKNQQMNTQMNKHTEKQIHSKTNRIDKWTNTTNTCTKKLTILMCSGDVPSG